jgi:hypothetical protein
MECGRGHAVIPIGSRLDGEGWPCRSQKKEIHARPIAPFVGIRVGKDDTGEGGDGGRGGRVMEGTIPERPSPEKELGAKVVVMI